MENPTSEKFWDLEVWYKKSDLRNRLKHFIAKMDIPEADVMDIFQESFIILDRNIKAQKFRGDSSIESYLFAIARNLSLCYHRKVKRINYVDDFSNAPEYETIERELEISEFIILEEEKQLIDWVLSMIQEPCKQILKMWQLSFSMVEIAEKLGLSSAEMAKKKRYQCHQKLIILLDQNPQIRELLI